MKKHLLKSVKIAVAALLSIFIAGELGLKYSATAGIITVLSIQNTKKETFRSAANRSLAYVCALILASTCFRIFGYTLPAFAVYLFLFAFLCMAAGWQEAITTDSVLITHFLNERSMSLQMLGNETALLIIGAGIGILVNLHLHSKEADFEKLAAEVDGQIKKILWGMSERLLTQDLKDCDGSCFPCLEDDDNSCFPGLKDDETGCFPGLKDDETSCFAGLEEAIRQAKLCAAANFNNTLRQKDTYELDYIRMREQQSVVLKGIYQNIRRLEYLPEQAAKVAVLIADIEQAYHKENTVEALLAGMQEFLEDMKQEEMPRNREEFEARAILFYILMQLKELLMIKRQFIAVRMAAESGKKILMKRTGN